MREYASSVDWPRKSVKVVRRSSRIRPFRTICRRAMTRSLSRVLWVPCLLNWKQNCGILNNKMGKCYWPVSYKCNSVFWDTIERIHLPYKNPWTLQLRIPCQARAKASWIYQWSRPAISRIPLSTSIITQSRKATACREDASKSFSCIESFNPR